MALLTLELRDWFTAALAISAAIGAIAGLRAFYKYKYADATHRADGESIKTWQGLAASRLAALTQVREDCFSLTQEVKNLKSELGECEQLRNEFAIFNLRLQAKNEKLQKSVNRLEDRLGIPLTNFDEPTPPTFGR